MGSISNVNCAISTALKTAFNNADHFACSATKITSVAAPVFAAIAVYAAFYCALPLFTATAAASAALFGTLAVASRFMQSPNRRINELNNELRQAENALTEEQKRYEQLSEETAQLSRAQADEIAALNDRIKDQGVDLNRTREAETESQNKLDKMGKELFEAIDARFKVDAEKAILNNKIAKLEYDLQQIQKSEVEAIASLGSLRTELSEANQKVAEAQNALRELTDERDALKQKLADAKDELTKVGESICVKDLEIDNLQKTKTDLTETNGTLMQQIGKIANELAESSQVLLEKNKQVDELKQLLEQVRADNKNLQGEVSSLKESIATMNKAEQQDDAAREERVKAELAAIEEEKARHAAIGTAQPSEVLDISVIAPAPAGV